MRRTWFALTLFSAASLAQAPAPAAPAAPAASTPAPQPATVAESTNFTATSRAADVERFLDELVKLPHGDRLAVEVAGKSHQGRAQLLIKAALPAEPGSAPRLRALVIGSIHAGECEGKEAIQVLLREIALGQHEAILRAADLWFLPLYNIDGNEAVSEQNRPGQNGPAVTGQRANAMGFDLNRDFVKADAPETRTLLGLFGRLDPHLFVDLHTTNGSYHGYHLTYAPSLSPNVDPGIHRLSRRLLELASVGMQQQGYATFDYGNFETRDWEGNGAPESPTGVRGFYTYDHRARYGINYYGLRNRIGILSEAYSYDDFATRIAATAAFVREVLGALVAEAPAVRATVAEAEQRLRAPTAPNWFGFDTTFAPATEAAVQIGEVDTLGAGPTVRYARRGTTRTETMPVVRGFRARAHRELPAGWAIREPSAEVVATLQRHGVQFTAVTAPQTVPAAVFQVTGKKKPKRPYQGHQELVLSGTWQPSAPTALPLGTLLVSARQPLARLAATLLEPESEDSLSTWNFFEAGTTDTYPVWRLDRLPE